jgi:prepilin-type N-terminal cleavage/methylation domain-containing protein
MKKEAFSLLELIFVLVIIGVLSGVGLYSFKPHYLRDDTNFVLLKLQDTKYKALSYDKSLNDGDINGSIGCIDLQKLNDVYDKKTKSNNYKFHSTITPPSDLNILCFDTYGRIYNGENDDNATTLESLIYNNVIITLDYGNEEKNITIMTHTGYIY